MLDIIVQENDIAILTLEKPVSRVRPVKLEAADPRKNHIGQTGLVIGWGRTRQVLYPNLSSGPASNHLRQVNVTIIRAQDCKIFYYDEYDIVENGGRMCAVTLQGKGICQVRKPISHAQTVNLKIKKIFRLILLG